MAHTLCPEEVLLTSLCPLLKPLGFSPAQGTICLHFYEQKVLLFSLTGFGSTTRSDLQCLMSGQDWQEWAQSPS